MRPRRRTPAAVDENRPAVHDHVGRNSRPRDSATEGLEPNLQALALSGAWASPIFMEFGVRVVPRGTDACAYRSLPRGSKRTIPAEQTGVISRER